MTLYVLWHNPRCSKSRAALDLLREHGIDATVRAYLDDPPTVVELAAVARCLGSAGAMIRKGEPQYSALGLSGSEIDDAALIGAMAAHPGLIERPILLRIEGPSLRAELGRPTERLLSLLIR